MASWIPFQQTNERILKLKDLNFKEEWVNIKAYFTAMSETAPLKAHILLGCVGFFIVAVIITCLILFIKMFGFDVVILTIICLCVLYFAIWGFGQIGKNILGIKKPPKRRY